MLTKKITVSFVPDGEVSIAALVVQKAGKFNSSIYIESNGRKINGKSIMGVMTIPFAPGEKLILSADGADEKEALDSLEEFLAK